MNQFVDECRREWKRLGVPDPVADEMAADLTADLEEADADGASPEDVLGSGAFDARSFAAAWAAERGVIGRPPPSGRSRGLVPAAIAALALVAIVGAVLVIEGSSSADERRSAAFPPPPPAAHALVIAATDLVRLLPDDSVTLAHEEGDGVLSITSGSHSSRDTRTVGSVLLIVALTGILLATVAWLLLGPGPWARHRSRVDNRPSGPAY